MWVFGEVLTQQVFTVVVAVGGADHGVYALTGGFTELG